MIEEYKRNITEKIYFRTKHKTMELKKFNYGRQNFDCQNLWNVTTNLCFVKLVVYKKPVQRKLKELFLALYGKPKGVRVLEE